MTLPSQSPRRRLRWLIVGGLLIFAAGLALGGPLRDVTVAWLDQNGPKLAEGSPRLFGWLGRRPTGAPAEAGSPQATPGAPVAVASTPTTVQPLTASQPVAPTVAPLAPSPEPPAPAPGRAGHGQHGRGGGKVAARPAALAAASAKKEPKEKDPFDLGDSPAPAASARKSKATVEEAAPAKTSPRPAGGDALDDLMGGVMTETKSKGKKDKSIDALLKDVQKSEPVAAPKREEAPAAEPLSPADIAKGMAVVKTKAKACAASTGQGGIAELKLTVGKNGRVADVIVGGKLAGSPLAACLDRAARTAVFRPNTGLTFDYKVDAR